MRRINVPTTEPAGPVPPAAFDLVAVGECLIDFAPSKQQEEGKLSFTGCPGGAPANVLACASRLGLRTALISKAGDDIFGKLLKKTMDGAGIDTSAMVLTPEYPTTLAFVALDEKGDRSFSFYRNQTADCMLDTGDLPADLLRSAKMLHYGTVSMSAEPSRTATIEAVKLAKAGGAAISYDPNLREFLWKDLSEARRVMLEMLALSDLVKLSGEELVFLTGAEDLKVAIRILFDRYPVSILVVTLAEEGCMCVSEAGLTAAPGHPVHAVDTTGAGDAFWGAFLYKVITDRISLDAPDAEKLTEALRFANAAGALTVTKPGAIPALPTLKEIENRAAIGPR